MKKVYLAIAASLLIWSNAFWVIQTALRELEPLEMVCLRFIPIGIGFLTYLAVFRLRRSLEIIRRDFWKLLSASVCLIPAYNWLLYTGQMNVSPSLAALIVGISPTITYLAAIAVRQESVSWRKGAGITLAFAGLYVAVVYGNGGELKILGYLPALFVLGAAVSISFYGVIMRSLLYRYGRLEMMALCISFGSLPLLVFVRPSMIFKLVYLSPTTWASMVYLVVLATLTGFYTWLYALKRLPATNVTVFVNAIPFLAMFFGFILFGEGISIWLVAGAVLLTGGIYLTTKSVS